ncbi:MAG: EF hand domain-containing protein [uncultured Aureispira sp.]|uniref:EF hand domain-containing protein n=1 Tax=uncultured Aureispira sp. TaxID=1331704 RepID=A0A6S6T2Z3_9BACT|nr:MAG: EF hand domain-containing protein [uncultured Aureispira sp.]
MPLSKELAKEFLKIQAAIEKFMKIHDNPHDTSKHNKVAEQLKEFNGFLSEVKKNASEGSGTPPTAAPASSSPPSSGRRSISASVGKGGKNKEQDVLTIQELLNKNSYNLEEDGKIGKKTIRIIKMFQSRLGFRPDGLISPGKSTMKGLLGEIPVGPPSTGISSIIQGGESGAAGYNAYNRGTKGNSILGPAGPRSLITMTLAEIMADQKLPKSDPKTLFAVGKYQMIPTTLKEGVEKLDLDHSTKFDATTQEYLFSDYLLGKKRPAIRAYIQGAGSAKAAGIAGAQEWASIARPDTGKSHYDGTGGNSAHITAEDFLATLDEAKEEYKKNIAAGMDPDAAYRKAVAGVQGEESNSETDTNTDTNNDTNTDPINTDSGDVPDTTDEVSGQDTIKKSVGKGGKNEAGDVSLVQELLNKKGESLKVDGKIGNNTINAIKRFQAGLNMGAPDGLIEPGKATIAALVGEDTSDTTETGEDDTTAGTPSAPGTKIEQSVGRKGANQAVDVQIIQEMLVKNQEAVGVDGKIGNETINAIISIQSRMGMKSPDGLIEPGKNTFKALAAGTVPPPFKPSGKYFSHPNANTVTISYGSNAVKLNKEAEYLLKSILAASGNTGATVTSSLRTYYHQARVMIQYYSVKQMEGLYKGGAELAAGRRAAGDNIQKFADFLEKRDKTKGTLISKHVPGYAIDVVPKQNRGAYAAKAKELVGQSGSGVTRFIELGQFGEKVDHIEFKMKVT